MPQHAPAYPFAARAKPSSVDDTLAAVAEAGRTITDLRAKLAEAERTIEALTAEKRSLLTQLRAVMRGLARPAAATPAPGRSHLDNALAAVLDGLGPSLVRTSPRD